MRSNLLQDMILVKINEQFVNMQNPKKLKSMQDNSALWPIDPLKLEIPHVLENPEVGKIIYYTAMIIFF